MPLIPSSRLFQIARERRFAVGFFESWDIASTQGVIDAAEEAGAPIIIGFNGDFMSGDERVAEERVQLYGALGRAAAETARVPCGFIFNECPKDRWVRAAVDAGFNIVMPADPNAGRVDYQRRVAALVAYAHSKGVAVEAGLEELPCGASGIVVGERRETDVQQAVDFVRTTGVDLLGVSVGNVHIRLAGEQSLNLDRLAALAMAVRAGLVLHGGTGIPLTDLRQAVTLGVVKVNFGTYVKQAWLKVVREGLAQGVTNPHRLLGMGGPEDVLMQGRKAVKEAVLERLEPLGCVGMAAHYSC
ncbi:MAG TPA: class II fructose-bisphosphate aldolase [Lacunisphaera sp.]|nr:class II fructose-bisphosphate aldolase [Lacunisphaera sp.]